MGKSTIGVILSEMGCPVHNSDAAVHDALLPGGAAFEEVAVTFPEAWQKKEHLIDRQKLGQIVFNDDEKRKTLESIVHPAVWASQDKFLMKESRMGRKFAALDIPLLFETNAQNRVDYTIVASAPYDIQKRRVMSRPGMTEEKFLNIVRSQMSDHEKRTHADYIVETGLGLAHTHQRIQQILREIQS